MHRADGFVVWLDSLFAYILWQNMGDLDFWIWLIFGSIRASEVCIKGFVLAQSLIWRAETQKRVGATTESPWWCSTSSSLSFYHIHKASSKRVQFGQIWGPDKQILMCQRTPLRLKSLGNAYFQNYIPEQPGILSKGTDEINISKVMLSQCCPIKKCPEYKELNSKSLICS